MSLVHEKLYEPRTRTICGKYSGGLRDRRRIPSRRASLQSLQGTLLLQSLECESTHCWVVVGAIIFSRQWNASSLFWWGESCFQVLAVRTPIRILHSILPHTLLPCQPRRGKKHAKNVTRAFSASRFFPPFHHANTKKGERERGNCPHSYFTSCLASRTVCVFSLVCSCVLYWHPFKRWFWGLYHFSVCLCVWECVCMCSDDSLPSQWRNLSASLSSLCCLEKMNEKMRIPCIALLRHAFLSFVWLKRMVTLLMYKPRTGGAFCSGILMQVAWLIDEGTQTVWTGARQVEDRLETIEWGFMLWLTSTSYTLLFCVMYSCRMIFHLSMPA